MSPEDTYEQAETLFRAATCQADFRTAASRAYMAAFQHVIRHKAVAAFQPSRTGSDHRDLIDFLKKSDNANLRRLAVSYLARLRSLRNHADYDLDTVFTRGLAEEALERASEIIYQFLPK